MSNIPVDDKYSELQNQFEAQSKQYSEDLFILAEQIRSTRPNPDFPVLKEKYNELALILGLPKINSELDPMYGEISFSKKPSTPTKTQAPDESTIADIQRKLIDLVSLPDIEKFAMGKKTYMRKLRRYKRKLEELQEKYTFEEFFLPNESFPEKKSRHPRYSMHSSFSINPTPEQSKKLNGLIKAIQELYKKCKTLDDPSIRYVLDLQKLPTSFKFLNLQIKSYSLEDRAKKQLLYFRRSQARVDVTNSRIRLPWLGWINCPGISIPNNYTHVSLLLYKKENSWYITIRLLPINKPFN